jgi:hypothetical protein
MEVTLSKQDQQRESHGNGETNVGSTNTKGAPTGRLGMVSNQKTELALLVILL